MQNYTLPIQVSPTSNAPAPNRANVQPNKDAPAFSQTLNREMAQRQARPFEKSPATPVTPIKVSPDQVPETPPAAPAAPTGPVRAIKHLAVVDNAATEAADAAAAAAAPVDDAATLAVATDPALAATDATATTAATAAAAEAGAAAAAPMSDMLAMVASYKQLMQGGAPAAKPEATATEDATATTKSVRGSGTGIADDTQTLAALQSALKKSDGADTGKATAQLDDGDTKPAASRAAPDLAATAAKSAAPQSEAALSTLRDAAATAVVKDTAPVNTGGTAFQAQLNSVEMAQAAVTQGSDRIPARLGTTAWDNQISQKVVWMVAGADQSATLTLNPPDLGPVQVVLNVTNDQATVAFSANTPEVREALENAMPRLRDMLGDAGVTLAESSVSANLPDQRQADTSGGNGSRNGNNGNHAGTGVRTGEAEIPVPRSASRAMRDDGVVDTFA